LTTVRHHCDRCGRLIEAGRIKLAVECGSVPAAWPLDLASGRVEIEGQRRVNSEGLSPSSNWWAHTAGCPASEPGQGPSAASMMITGEPACWMASTVGMHCGSSRIGSVRPQASRGRSYSGGYGAVEQPSPVIRGQRDPRSCVSGGIVSTTASYQENVPLCGWDRTRKRTPWRFSCPA
jgi:hypothetical protein